ncbi:hypothetical protein CRG98_015905 [Punica granatum]|uniref:DUF668 domain-containing protein n=1 Tax=Punica granatum TaxID=22663 RepID=A0A2I0K594_PUNGR|nr:hypothetical protein CRG98_015905 [Punica granatum]
MVAESWFRSLWGKPRKHGSSNPPKSVIGVLAFEFASLMSKSVHLWQSLSDKNITRLREEIASSPGIQKLVSDDEDFIANLIRSEMIENVVHVAKSVARLGHRCNDPSLKNFGSFFESMMALGLDPLGWKFTSKKMESKVKKMERFISMNVNLYQEMEVLGDLEQTLRRMKGSESSDPGSLLEYQKKVVWKRHEVKNLQGNSLWNKNYDYAVLLLARSLFTIFARIKQVFGIQQVADFGDPKDSNSKDNGNVGFYSGPLGKLTKSGPLFGVGKIARGVWQSGKGHSSVVRGKKSNSKTNQLTSIGPLKGCMTGGDVNSANLESNQNRDIKHEQPNDGSLLSFSSKHSLLNAPPESLGYAGLALHYANVIIVIEKLAASPHLIGLDARDDLYNMLPATVRSSLRARLKPYANALSSYDPVLAGEWSEAITGILEWLGPLAHNMIRWQSERSFEQQNLVSRANVLVVQTLYFANKEKTEAIITELLVGLNYIWRFGRELNSKALVGCASSRAFDEYLDIQG